MNKNVLSCCRIGIGTSCYRYAGGCAAYRFTAAEGAVFLELFTIGSDCTAAKYYVIRYSAGLRLSYRQALAAALSAALRSAGRCRLCLCRLGFQLYFAFMHGHLH